MSLHKHDSTKKKKQFLLGKVRNWPGAIWDRIDISLVEVCVCTLGP